MKSLTCDSCSKSQPASESKMFPEALPRGWAHIDIRIGMTLVLGYDLCGECSSQPMTFGQITINPWSYEEPHAT